MFLFTSLLLQVGDKFEKPGECLECTCNGAGDGDCEATECNTKCGKVRSQNPSILLSDSTDTNQKFKFIIITLPLKH